MFIKKRVLLLSAAILMIFSLSGCQTSTNADPATDSSKKESTALSSGSVTLEIEGKTVSFSGAYVVDGIEAEINGGTYESTGADQNVFLVINGGKLTLNDVTINKTGEATQSDSSRSQDVSDSYNFYGINSVVLVIGENSVAQINNCTITSNASGANAVFALDGANISLNSTTINTDGNSSRGLYATYGGIINAADITISTKGAHCAALATDRGGGSVNVSGNSTLNTDGDGSPCIYSTGNITVDGAKGEAKQSQTLVIEGKNSVTLTNCELTANGNNGLMMYQSMSGDASDKDASSSHSTLYIKDSTLSNNANDTAMIYITNTEAEITFENVTLSNTSVLIQASSGRWGTDGANGGTLVLNAKNQTLTGAISADSISSINITLDNASTCNSDTSGSVSIVKQ